METRACITGELRLSKGEGQATRIGGYAALFDSDSVDLGGFVERIARGAFSSSLSSRDIRALWDHQTGALLGRQSSGTLRLTEDARGLAFELDLPDTQPGRDVAVLAERKDLTGVSFRFENPKDTWAKIGPGKWLRTLLDVPLIEISPVAFPAYPATEMGLRSAGVTDEAAVRLRAAIEAEAQRDSRRRRTRLAEIS